MSNKLDVGGEVVVLSDTPPCEYRQAPTELSLSNEARTVFAGRAIRTGVTPPGYPDRAVYRIVLTLERPQPGYYVYDAGELVLHTDWIHREQERR